MGQHFYTMNLTDPSCSREVCVADLLGLHARLAAKIMTVAKKAKSAVWIIRGKDKRDASNILDILTISCSKGSLLTVEIDNPLDIDCLNQIADLINRDTGE
jgi:phosphotransferase system HPr (HPr) family protein